MCKAFNILVIMIITTILGCAAYSNNPAETSTLNENELSNSEQPCLLWAIGAFEY